MSSTKILIIVLVLVGLLFIIFVARGALRDEAPPPTGKSLNSSAKKTKPPDWTKTVKGLFNSLQPKIELKQKIYSANAEETIKADDKQPFRTVTFHRLSGQAEITYADATPLEPNSPLKEMDRPQRCPLPQEDADVSDKERCSILAMKAGGKLTFACKGNSACRVEVE
jgi:hypothetical protein